MSIILQTLNVIWTIEQSRAAVLCTSVHLYLSTICRVLGMYISEKSHVLVLARQLKCTANCTHSYIMKVLGMYLSTFVKNVMYLYFSTLAVKRTCTCT